MKGCHSYDLDLGRMTLNPTNKQCTPLAASANLLYAMQPLLALSSPLSRPFAALQLSTSILHLFCSRFNLNTKTSSSQSCLIQIVCSLVGNGLVAASRIYNVCALSYCTVTDVDALYFILV